MDGGSIRDQKESSTISFIIFTFYLLLIKSTKPHANTEVQKESQTLSRMQKNTKTPKMNQNCT